jgi:hypothetical protein
MNDNFEKQITALELSHRDRKAREAKVWEGWMVELSQLSGIVSTEFRKVAREVLAEETKHKGVELGDIETNYLVGNNAFSVIVQDATSLENGEKVIIGRNDYRCLYTYLRKLVDWGVKEDPRVAKFKKDYHVHYIGVDCNCGSDHK